MDSSQPMQARWARYGFVLAMCVLLGVPALLVTPARAAPATAPAPSRTVIGTSPDARRDGSVRRSRPPKREGVNTRRIPRSDRDISRSIGSICSNC
ncbi:hypothetical protein [Chelatococcus reniformis]|uniref:hypothetical protein n=1 Tax=Chelatococcus reniformis TaxID=1494448 RepID=UPI00166ED0CD|nr:hypothetical protein [Chelatococcus reniformis]